MMNPLSHDRRDINSSQTFVLYYNMRMMEHFEGWDAIYLLDRSN